MKRKRHTPEQIVRKLREGDRMLNQGTNLTEVLRHLEVSAPSKARRPAPIDDGELRGRLRAIAKAHPRWGYKMATRVVGREGWHVNRKRVQRIWRDEGLKRPPQGRKRRRVRLDTAERLTARHPNHVWAIDFEFAETADLRRLNIANIVDECTREALVMPVRRC